MKPLFSDRLRNDNNAILLKVLKANLRDGSFVRSSNLLENRLVKQILLVRESVGRLRAPLRKGTVGYDNDANSFAEVSKVPGLVVGVELDLIDRGFDFREGKKVQ